MIDAGDRVMVCLSGGKDSYGLLDVLLQAARRTRRSTFEIVAVNLDQRHPGYPEHVLPDYLTALGIPYRIEVQDTYSVVKRVIPEGKTMCSLCSRLRRGVLYRVASELGATQDRARPSSRRHSGDVFSQPVFRRQAEGDAAEAGVRRRRARRDPAARLREGKGSRAPMPRCAQFPIIPCDLCGSQPTLQRKQMKQMLRDWEKQYPGTGRNAYSAACRTCALRTCSTANCSTFAAVAADRHRSCRMAIKPLIRKRIYY